MPDDFGNALIDRWMAAKGIARSAITPLDRLAYMGRRGMGALEFRPVRGPNVASHTAIKLGRLVESARRVVQGQLDADPGVISRANEATDSRRNEASRSCGFCGFGRLDL